MTTIDRQADARASRFSLPTLQQLFWGTLAKSVRRIGEWRRMGMLGKHNLERRRRALRFEALEPRLLLSADLTYGDPSNLPSDILNATEITDYVNGLLATDFTLQVTNRDGGLYWDLIAAGVISPVDSHLIDDASDLTVTVTRDDLGISNASLSLIDFVGDTLTIDADSLALLDGQFGGTTVDIDFAGGKDIDLGDLLGIELPTFLGNDQVILAGDGTLNPIAHAAKVHSSSDIVSEADGFIAAFTGTVEVISDSSVTIDGGSAIAGSAITLKADAKSTGGIVGGLLANASSEVILDGSSLTATGGTVSLLALSDITFTENGDTFFGDGLSATAVLSISGATVDVRNGASISAANANLEASIKTDITATAQASDVRIVAVNVFNSPSVTIQGLGTSIDVTGDVTVKAASDVEIDNTTVPDDAAGETDSDAAVSETLVSSAPAFSMTGGTVTAQGSVSFLADNKIKITSTADGAQGGSDGNGTGGAGATLGFSMMLGGTSAGISGGSVTADAISLKATSDRDATTVSKATKGGAQEAGGGAGSTNKSEQRLKDPNNDGGTSDQASTDEGSIDFAAAIAVGVAIGDTTVGITGGTVHATDGDLIIEAKGKTTLTTTADGSTKVDDGSNAVGAAVAINVATPDVIATLGGTANVDGDNVKLSALVPTSKIQASATSGASGGDLGIAGSLALNVVVMDTYARVGGSVNVNGANVAVTAESDTTSKAVAKATVEDASDVGVGASVVINIADNDTHAELLNGAVLTGADDLALSAKAKHGMVTEAKGGAEGGTAVTPIVAVSIATYDTRANVGSGVTLTVAGDLTANAEHDISVNTLADGEAAGSDAAVGAAIAFTYSEDHAVATTFRDIAASGAVAFTARSVAQNATRAKASASGAEDSGQDAQSQGDSKRGAGNSRAGNSGTGAQGSGTESKATAETSGDSEGEGSGISVAAAIAINIVDSEARAEIPTTVTVSSGGLLTVRSSSNVDGTAIADGRAVTADGGDAAVGAAVSVNTVDAANIARVDGSVSAADGMVVEALMADRKIGLQTAMIDIVDTDEDTIFLGTEHGLTSGQKVKYRHGDGGSDIDGLDDGSEYWVHDAGGGKVKLYSTNADDAKAGGDTGRVDLTNDGSGNNHSFGTFINVPMVGEVENPFGGKVKFDPDPNSMRVIELGENHGLRTGDAVVYHRGADVGEIGNLDDGDTYYVIVLDETHAQLAETREKALDGEAIELTSDDVGDDDFLTERTHSTFASSTSGAGGADVGVAGSVAINRAAVVTTAEVEGDVTLADGGDGGTGIGALKVRAHSTSDNTAVAQPAGDGAVAESVGVGASFALNLMFNDTTADLKNGASISGSAGSVTVEAIGEHRTSTEARNGAKGGTGVGAAVAVVVSESDTLAHVGTGATLNTAGAAIVTAQHANIVDTKVSSEAEGEDAAIGASVGVHVISDTNNAQIARGLHSTGGGVALSAEMDLTVALDVHASAAGGDSSGDDADSEADSQTNNNSNTGGGKQMESAGSNTSSANSESSSQTGSQGEEGGGGGVGIAAAVAINIVRLTNTATVTNGADLTGEGGAVSISAQASVDSKAQADGMSVNFSEGAGTVISAAVALNFVNLTNTATVGSGSTVSGDGVTIEAVTTDGERNDFVATAFAVSAADSDSPAIAGVFALNVIDVETKAQALDGSTLESTGGVTVAAEHDMGLQALAASVALSTEGTTVGGAIAINKVGTGTGGSNTLASIGTPDGSGATVNADGAVSVSAEHTMSMTGTVDLPATINEKMDDPSVSIGSLAVAASGSSSGSASIAGSVAINWFETTTQASVARESSVTGKTGASAGSLSVTATDTLDWASVAGSVGVALDGVGIGAGLDLAIIDKDTRAYIGRGADVEVSGDVTLTALSTESILAIAANAGIGLGSVGIGATAAVQVIDTQTRAYVEDDTVADSTHVNAGQDVTVSATGTLDIKLIAAAIGAGNTVGVGAGNATLVHTDVVEAYVGNFASVTSGGGDGVRITAHSSEELIAITAAGSGGGNVAVSGAATVIVLDETTTARVGRGAHITATPLAGTPDLWVKADDSSTLVTVAGSLALSGSVSVGVGLDVAKIDKETKAYIDSGVIADVKGDIDVSANSTEDITSVAAGLSASGSAAVTADASVHVIDNTTRAFIGDEDGIGSLGAGDVHADGSVRILANNSTEIDKVVGAASFSGSAAITAGAGVTVSKKTTEAFIGKGAKVSGDGNSTLDAPTGSFALNAVAAAAAQQYNNEEGADNSNAAGIEAGSAHDQSASDLAGKGEVAPPTPVGSGDGASEINGQPAVEDPNLTQNVHLSPNTAAARGVIVGATSNDDLESYSIGLAGAGSAAIAVAASVNVVSATTSAYIADDAIVNDDTSGAHTDQQVTVVAANDFRHTAAAAGLAVSGGASIAPAVDVTVSDNTTTASIGAGASVKARDDVRVIAKATEDILLVGVGIAGGTVGIGGGVNVLSINNVTTAAVAGTVRADGDLLVRATDDTDVMVIDGGLGVGYVGVGAGIGVVIIDKTTTAAIADGANVSAKGFDTGETVRDGSISGMDFGTTTAHGVIVDAQSSEELFHLAIAGGGGFVGASGSVVVNIVTSDTSALIGAAQVNQFENNTASTEQDVFVNASNKAEFDTFALAVAGGVVGIGGAVDVGVVNNSTSARIATGANVASRDDIEVNAASIKEIDSLTLSGGFGLAGLAGAVSVWSVGETLSESYEDSEGTSGSALEKNKKDEGDADNKVNVDDDARDQSNSARNEGIGSIGAIDQEQPGPTSGRIGNAKSGANDAVDDSKVGTGFDVKGKINAAPLVVGTSAIIEGGSTTAAGGKLDVQASEKLDFSSITGTAGIGAVGIAGGISVLSVGTNVTAAAGGTLSSGESLTVQSRMEETLNVTTVAVSGGLVGLGAAVAVINDNSTSSATLSGTVLNAGSIQVTATSIQNINVIAGQASVGGAAIGAVWADVDVGGSTSAGIGNNAQIGQSGSVGGLLVEADATADVTSHVIGASGGAGLAVSANFSFIDLHPTVSAGIGDGAQVTTLGAIDVNADTHLSASSDVVGVAGGGGLAVALSWVDVAITPTVTASLGANAMARSTGGGVNFRARHNAGGGDGGRKAEANAVAASGAGIASGAGARAEGTHSAAVSATGGTGSSVQSAGASGFAADNVGRVEGYASGGSGSLLGSISFMSATMTSGGSSTVSFDGSVQDSGETASDFSLAAEAHRIARVENFVIGLGGLFGGAAAAGTSSASGSTTATFGGNSSIDIGGNLGVNASSTNLATSKVEGGAGGLLGGGAIFKAQTTAGGTTEAKMSDGADVLGAANVAIESLGSSTASSNTVAGTGGIVSAGGVQALVTVTPTVKSSIGANSSFDNVTGSVRVTAESTQAEGDAKAAAYGGGVVQIGVATAEGTVTPTVTASIGTGTTIDAAGDVLVSADSRYTPGGEEFGDTFNAGTADYGADVITFTAHGLGTGDTVVYNPNGNAQITTAGGGTLGNDREYNVIVRGDDTLSLGNDFDGGSVTALRLFYPDGFATEGVDGNRDMIRFSVPHNFANGDAVRYDHADGDPAIGIAEGTYYVHVVDDFTIKLFASRAEALDDDETAFGVGSVTADDRIVLAGFDNDDRVTYRDPAPAAFRANGVDRTIDGDNKIDGFNNNNTIYLGTDLNNNGVVEGHSFNNGDKVVYRTEGAPADEIGGLNDGQTYYVIKVDNYRIQLSHTLDGTNGDDPDIDDDIGITPISISGSGTDGDTDQNRVRHWLVRPSLGVLQDGATYYVVNKGAGGNANDFQLSETEGGAALDLDDSERSGLFSLSKAGIDIAPAADGDTHELVIDMTGGSGQHLLLGEGGISLRTIAPPPGDGKSAVSAQGGGGGLIAGGDPDSKIIVEATVTAQLNAASVESGGNVEVTASADDNISAYAKNTGGGFVQAGNTDATAIFAAETSATIGSGTVIEARGDFELVANNSLTAKSHARAEGGGFLAFADADSDVIFDDGSYDGTNYNGGTTATVGSNAQIEARGVSIRSGYDDVSISVSASTEAGGFTGTSSATAREDADLDAKLNVNGGATVHGREGVDLRILNPDSEISISTSADAVFYGLSAGDPDEEDDGSIAAVMTTADGATIIAAPRIEDDTILSTADMGTLPSLALLAQIDSESGARTMTWNADVILQSGPSPYLVVNADGVVVKAVNVFVDGGNSVGYDTDQGGTKTSFEVDDIVNDDRGQAMFKSNGTASLSETAGGFPLFTFRDTYLEVNLINESANHMVVNDVGVINTTASTPDDEVYLRVSNVNGFEFDVTHDFKPTYVTVKNTDIQPGHSPDIRFAGLVDNPIGVTTIFNAQGDIYSIGGGTVRTDSFAIDAAAGSVGTGEGQRLSLQIVESNDGPTGEDVYRHIDAAQDIFLEERGLQRRALAGPETADSGFFTNVDWLNAGHDVNVLLRHGTDQTTPSSVDYQIEVNQAAVVVGPTPAAVDVVRTHFRSSNEPGGVAQLFPLGVFGTGSADTNVTYEYGVAGDGAKRIIAGNDIDVTGPITGTLSHVFAYTNILALGNIDVLTKGDITITEVAGDLRVGRIASVGRDVELNSPRRILDAISGEENDGDGGLDPNDGVEADVTGYDITMTAGNNGIGGMEGTGGIGTNSNFLEINVDVLDGDRYDTAGNAVAGGPGVLNAFDIDSGFSTQGIRLTEVLRGTELTGLLGGGEPGGTGEMMVDTVHTMTDVSLAAEHGSILDARNNGNGTAARNVIGNSIDIFAQGGSIGDVSGSNDLDIDSQEYAVGDVGLRATDSIYVTETESAAAPDIVAPDFQNLDPSAADVTGYGLHLILAQTDEGDVRLTVRESADLDEDLILNVQGSARFVEGVLESVSDAGDHEIDSAGWVELRIGDDLVDEQGGSLPGSTFGNSVVQAGEWIDIYLDNANLDADHGAHTTFTGTYRPGPLAGSSPAHPNIVRIFGHTDVDTLTFDETDLDGKTEVRGSQNTSATDEADGEDRFTVNRLLTMDVTSGHTLTLDGQAETDYYTVYTTGSQASVEDRRNYVINILDTGAEDDGVDEAAIYGIEAAEDGYVGDPQDLVKHPADDIFLLRKTQYIPSLQPGDAASSGPYGVGGVNMESADDPAFVALLHGDLALHRDLDPDNAPTDVQRINYDAALNGRLNVYGLSGNDYFAADDNSAITQLDGGHGFDTFQIGQIFGSQRDNDPAAPGGLDPDDAQAPEFGGALEPHDVFPKMIATTRGWLSPGASAPMIVSGGTGNDEFVVYANQAELRLEGDDDNDLFIVRAFALAAVVDTDTNGDGLLDTNDLDDPFGIDTNMNGVADAGDEPIEPNRPLNLDRPRIDTNGDGVFNAADAHTTLDTNGDNRINLLDGPNHWQDDKIILDFVEGKWVARPIIGLGFSTDRPLDIRAGGGEDEVQYNVNAPVSVDGGTGFDKLVVLATEFADDIAITSSGIFGAGLNVRYDNVEVVEVDGLEGDDEFFVQSTAFGVAYRVIGGLGSDIINVTGDVTADIVARELEGASGFIDHLVTSDDIRYDGLPVDGLDYNVASGDEGLVVITESGSGTTVTEGGDYLLPPGTRLSLDSYTVRLASPSANWVYVTVSVARSPQEEADDILPNPAPLVDGEGDTMWITTGVPGVDPMQDFRRHYDIDGVPHHEPSRAVVLAFAPGDIAAKTVYLYAVDDTRSEGDRVIVSQHSVISADERYDGLAVRNVEVSLRDNDTPGIYVTEVGPGTDTEDGRTLVIEGTTINQDLIGGPGGTPDGMDDYTGLIDEILVELARAPDGTQFVADDLIVTELVLDADSEREVFLVNVDGDSRFHIEVVGDQTRYFIEFDSTNWDDPVRVGIQARDDDYREDPGTAVVSFVQHKTPVDFGGYSVTPVDADGDYVFPNLRSGPGLFDIEVIDDEAAGVVALESGTNTQLIVDDLSTGINESLNDTYTVRLTRMPTSDVDVAVLTDGLADIVKIGNTVIDPRDDYQVVGGYLAAQAFDGTLDIAGAVITRGEGSDLGSFLDEGFEVGQRVRLALTTDDGDNYTVYDTETDGLTPLTIVAVTEDSITLSDSLMGVTDGSYELSKISRLASQGLYTGNVVFTTGMVDGQAFYRMTRTDGSGWLADGFLEGQRLRITGGANAGDYKIAIIRGQNDTKDETIEFTLEFELENLAPTFDVEELVTVARTAAVVTFHSDGLGEGAPDDWYVQRTVELHADPYFEVPLVREGVKNFPASTHLLSKLRGPLAVEGGPTGADRSLQNGLKLPGEADAPLIEIGPQPPEGRAIDVLNLFNDSSQEDLGGTMTETTLTGFGMAKDLDFGPSLDPSNPLTFGEPTLFPGGVSFGSIAFVDGQFSTDGAKSSVEVVNFLGGQGNDSLLIEGTLNPAVPVSGTGTFTVADDAGELVLTKAGWDWRAQGFLPEQTVTIYDYTGGMKGETLGTFEVLDITDDNPLDTFNNTELRLMQLSGDPLPLGAQLIRLEADDDPVNVTLEVTMAGTPDIEGSDINESGGTITRASGSWEDDGFEKGQLLLIESLPGSWRILEVTPTVMTVRGHKPPNALGIALPDRISTETLSIADRHGGLTVVHGGGNFELSLDARINLGADYVERRDGRDWQDDGYAVGQFVTIEGLAGTWKIVGLWDPLESTCRHASLSIL